MRSDFILVCKNGHRTFDRGNFCQECGALVISECSNCGALIRENSIIPFTVPKYCTDCGIPYPWVEAAIQATAELLAEDENITPDECNRLLEILPDTISVTPKSNLAAARLRKALNILGNFAADGLRQFLLDHACDLVKQQLGL